MRTQLGMMALLASACTGEIGTDPGGGGSGGPPPPPPATDVRVTVQDGFVPVPGVRVLYQNADGSLVQELSTDATGAADIDFPGGNITVIRTFPIPTTQTTTPRPTAVYTYVGVKAGDRLVVGDEQSTNAAMLSAVNVSVPTTAQGTVSLVAACGSGQGQAPTVPITVGNCPATVTFYGEDQGGATFLARVPYGNPVDLSASSLANSLGTSFSATNVGPDIQNVNVEARIVDGTYTLWSSGTKQITNQSANVDLPNVQGADELLVTMIDATAGSIVVGQRQTYAVTPTSIDVSAMPAIPYVKTVTYSPTGVSWAEEGSGSADFVIARLDVTAASTASYQRIIIAPHTGMSLPLPLLTGADAVYNPSAADQIAGTQSIGKASGGYDAARARAFAVTSLAQTPPMNGAVTLSYSGNPVTLGPN